MWRRLFNTLTALSLVLLTGLVVVWVWSYWSSDAWSRWDPERDQLWSVVVHAGGVQVGQVKAVSRWLPPEVLERAGGWYSHPRVLGQDWQLFTGAGTTRHHDWLGLRFTRGAFGNGESRYAFWSIRVPFWCMAVAALACPAEFVLAARRRWRRERRRSRGLCAACGYDLRASEKRCPECGALVEDGPLEPARPARQ